MMPVKLLHGQFLPCDFASKGQLKCVTECLILPRESQLAGSLTPDFTL